MLRAKNPIIGITAARQHVRYGVWDHDAAVLSSAYLDMVSQAGGVPILLPPQAEQNNLANIVLDAIDGLMVPGGVDVDSELYGQAASPQSGSAERRRDIWEISLLRGAIERDMPVLGICRGMQLLNVALGGTLCQHLDAPHMGSEDGHETGLLFLHKEISVVEGSLLFEMMGFRAEVFCYHHQAIGTTGRDLHVVAYDATGVIEALELSGSTFAVGVQWHPERSPADSRLSNRFIREAAEYLYAGGRRISISATSEGDRWPWSCTRRVRGGT
jgi:putative glutamine amidotransferase